MAHLTLEQRYKIALLILEKYSITAIGEKLGVNKSVISRELSRNCDERNHVYKADLAHKKAVSRHKLKAKKKYFEGEVKERVTFLLQKDYSPEQIVGYCGTKNEECVSVERIYQFVWSDKKAGGRLYKHLRTKGKRYSKRGALKGSRGIIKDRIGIENRPSIVDNKHRIGDLEIDLVIGQHHKYALLTIVDRAVGTLNMAKINSKEADEVATKVIELLSNFTSTLHTITSDNGKEFAHHKRIAEALNLEYYFANPYSSWERGANENLNGLVRQYFPKKSNFEEITQKQIEEVINKLNNRPRKRFGFKTPNEMLALKLTNAA
jgi:IS30 family transposase